MAKNAQSVKISEGSLLQIFSMLEKLTECHFMIGGGLLRN